MEFSDEHFMQIALQQAGLAMAANEVPVGVVLVCKQQVIAKAYNQVELLRDVTAHAEILAITSAAAELGGKYLQDCTLYVTLEPCIMCLGAIGHAHIRRVVYGAKDTRKSIPFDAKELAPGIELVGGVLAAPSEALLRDFFAGKRQF